MSQGGQQRDGRRNERRNYMPASGVSEVVCRKLSESLMERLQAAAARCCCRAGWSQSRSRRGMSAGQGEHPGSNVLSLHCAFVSKSSKKRQNSGQRQARLRQHSTANGPEGDKLFETPGGCSFASMDCAFKSKTGMPALCGQHTLHDSH